MTDVLKNARLFSSLTPDEVAAVVAAASRRSLPKAQVVFKMGDVNHSLFVLLSGAVTLERLGTGANVSLGTLGPGKTFGEMSFMDGSRVSATVRTSEPTEVLEITHPALDKLLGERPELVGKLWRNLALELKDRLARTNELVDHYADVNQLLAEDPSFRDSYGRV